MLKLKKKETKNTTEQVSNTPKKVKRKRTKSQTLLIIGLLVIFIPCAIYAGIIISAALQTGKPITGERFDNDLDPEITKKDISSIENKIGNLEGVEKVGVVLISGQMRVNVDTLDTLTSEEIETLTNQVYDEISSVLAVEKYFTSTGSKRMYDLAINVYNFVDAENEDMIYYILTKNAMMEEKTIQVVSEPLNPELAAELRGENEETTDDTQTEE